MFTTPARRVLASALFLVLLSAFPVAAERTGLFRTTWLQDRLPGKTLIHGVKLGVHSLAVTDALLSAGEPVTGMLGEVEVAFIRQEDGGITARRTDSGSALIVRTAYWFAWSTYYPRTAVME